MQNETTENYLKTIYHLSKGNTCVVTNKQLSEKLRVIPATVTEAVKKLAALKLVIYEKSYGARLTPQGSKLALAIVRRHRIWETFLVKVLDFKWDEVHEIAEELEHIKNDKLISKLSEMLGHPSFDPHGEPIPDEKGKIQKILFTKLADGKIGKSYKISGVAEDTPEFLKYLDKNSLTIGATLKIQKVENFDHTMTVMLEEKKQITITERITGSILIS